MKRNNIINLAEYALFRTAIWIFRLLPYSWSKKIITALFHFAGLSLGIRKKTAELQLSKVYPDLSPEERKTLLRKIYYNMGLTIAEIYLMKDEKLIEESTFENKKYIDEARVLGKGVILATAHFGNWEAARILPSIGIPFSVVVKKQHNPYFDAYNNKIRVKQGLGIIDYRKGLRAILSKLNKNEVVVIAADQNAGKFGVVLDFLGYPASHWKGVAKISLRYKIPVVPGFALRTKEGKIKFSFEPLIYHPELEDNEENCIFILRRLNEAIEKYIDLYPEQWFWVHKRWKATGAMKESKDQDILNQDTDLD